MIAGMPRRLRPDPPGARYHVLNRGADRQDVFSGDADHAYFETLLADATTAHGVEVHAYALMTNHFHLLLHCPDGGLSATMKDVQAVYVSTYNHHHGRSGPMFEGRFTSIPLDSPSARHLAGRYIHRNPLDIVPVRSLDRYRWSSLGAYTGSRPTPPWLHTHELAAPFDDADALLRHVTTRLPSDAQADRLRSAGPAGTLLDLDEAVASVCGVPVDTLRRRNVRNTPRILAITLAVELRVMSSAELAVHYRLRDPASIRSIARRGRVRLADDPAFAALRNAVLRRDDRKATNGA